MYVQKYGKKSVVCTFRNTPENFFLKKTSGIFDFSDRYIEKNLRH
jgi:hypothetical protein